MSAELLAIPADFEFQGKLHKVCHRDIFIEGQFAQWCMVEAALDLDRLQRGVSADFYDRQMRLYNTKVCGKQFRWGSEDVNNAAWSEPGQKHLLWLKIMRGQASGGAAIEREKLDEIAKDAAKWQQLTDILYQQDYPDFFAKLQQERGNQSPAAAAAASPSASTPA